METLAKIRTWIAAHPWELATGVLAVSLVAVLAFWRPTGPESTPDETTTTGQAVTTTTTAGGAVSTSSTATTLTTSPPVGEGVNPFTGETGVGGNLAIVKVDNAPGARPQIGLTPADLIIEVPVEGGITRFTALSLNTAPGLVGPIRSLRPVDADLLAPFPGTIIATGGRPHVVGMVTSAGLALADPNTSGLLQALERPRPHHLFATVANASLEVPLGTAAPWSYGDWAGGEAASSVSLSPGSEMVEWRWEQDSWRRYSDGALTEVLSDFEGALDPLGREVVIVLAANQKSGGYFDSAGAEVPDFDVVGGGELWILHNGEVVEGSWIRASQAEPWTFFDSSGEPLAVPLGSLYLTVVPAGSPVTIAG